MTVWVFLASVITVVLCALVIRIGCSCCDKNNKPDSAYGMVFALAFLIAAISIVVGVIFIPREECYLYTDTGVCVEIPPDVNVFLFVPSESYHWDCGDSVKVKHEDGIVKRYPYDEWYRIETVEGKSYFEQWIGR